MTRAPHHRRLTLWTSIATFGLAIIIAVATLLPTPPGGVPGSDKLYHVLAFAGLAFPLAFARPRWAVWVSVGATAFGGGIELIQPSVGRSAEWADLWADGLGAILGAVFAVALAWCLRRARRLPGRRAKQP